MDTKHKPVLMEILNESAMFRIINYFMDIKNFPRSRKQICRDANISKSKLYKNWHKIVNYNIVECHHQVGKEKFFIIDVDNDIVKSTIELRDCCDKHE